MGRSLRPDRTRVSVCLAAAALLAFGLREAWKAPPWVVMIRMAAAGQPALA